ncbi:MAG: hypothetical protein ACYTFX_08775 [Planctomycetota bacterium]|jgi:hypothetical protein
MKAKLKYLFIPLFIVIFFISLPFIVLLFDPWSEILCSHYDINIKTGQSRSSHYVYFIKISEEVKDTALSNLVKSEIDHKDIPAWHHVNTFSPIVSHSPHYRFHCVLGAIHSMEMCFEIGGYTGEEKREIAIGLLKAWQESGDYFGGDEYINEIFEAALEREEMVDKQEKDSTD